MRHVSAIAATAHPRHRHHQQPENAMMVAHSANNTDGILIAADWQRCEDGGQADADVLEPPATDFLA